jgi:hypothetical protein
LKSDRLDLVDLLDRLGHLIGLDRLHAFHSELYLSLLVQS